MGALGTGRFRTLPQFQGRPVEKKRVSKFITSMFSVSPGLYNGHSSQACGVVCPTSISLNRAISKFGAWKLTNDAMQYGLRHEKDRIDVLWKYFRKRHRNGKLAQIEICLHENFSRVRLTVCCLAIIAVFLAKNILSMKSNAHIV